jgi:hypothetical protein
MANATLVITATLTNGGTTKNIEMEMLRRASELALQQAGSACGTVTSGTATAEFGSVSATFAYTPVASS